MSSNIQAPSSKRESPPVERKAPKEPKRAPAPEPREQDNSTKQKVEESPPQRVKVVA